MEGPCRLSSNYVDKRTIAYDALNTSSILNFYCKNSDMENVCSGEEKNFIYDDKEKEKLRCMHSLDKSDDNYFDVVHYF